MYDRNKVAFGSVLPEIDVGTVLTEENRHVLCFVRCLGALTVQCVSSFYSVMVSVIWLVVC